MLWLCTEIPTAKDTSLLLCRCCEDHFSGGEWVLQETFKKGGELVKQTTFLRWLVCCRHYNSEGASDREVGLLMAGGILSGTSIDKGRANKLK